MSSFQFKLRKIDAARNHLLEEINHNDLMIEKCKKTCRHLNYVEHLLALVSTVTGCISISAFASLVWVSVGRYYEFYSRNTNSCNHCRSQKV